MASDRGLVPELHNDTAVNVAGLLKGIYLSRKSEATADHFANILVSGITMGDALRAQRADEGSLVAALERWPRLIPTANADDNGVIAEVPVPYGRGLRRMDELLSRERRAYRVRSVQRVLLSPPDREEEGECTSPS